MASNRIYIQVDFQSQDANAAITSLNQNIADIGTKSDTATKQATAGVKGFSVSVDQARTAIDSLAQAITGMGIAQMIKEVLALGDALLRVTLSFQRFGDGASALRSVQALAEETGLSFQGLLESANSLKNAGVPILEIAHVLKVFADQAAFAGVAQDKMNTAVEAFAKLSAKEFVTGKELVVFKEVGLDVLPILAEKTGQSIQKLRTEMHQFSASAVQDLILVTAQAMSMGAAAEQAAKLPSAHFQKLKNDIALLAEEMLKALAPALIAVADGLRGITEDAKAVAAEFASWPEWVKTLIELLVALAAAAKAAAIAFSLWSALPAAFGWLSKLVGILGAIGPAMLEIAAAGGSIGEILVPLGLGFEALIAAITPLTPVLIAAGLAWEAYEYAAYRANTSQATTDAMKKAFADRQDLAEQADKIYASLPKAQQAIADTARGKRSYQSETIDELKTQIEMMKKMHGDLIEADEKAIEAANKRAAEFVEEAMKRSLVIGKESIAALTEAYKAHFRAVQVEHADNTARMAQVQKAYTIDVATEIAKMGEALKKENEKAAQESVATLRKITIARAELIPDSTYAGKESLAKTVSDADEARIRESFSLRMDKQDELVANQIEGVKKGGLAEADKVRDIAKLESDLRDYHYDQIKLRDEEVALHRLEAEKKVNELIEEDRKQHADESLQDQITAIQQAGSLRVAVLGAAKAESLPERLKQMRDVQGAQIEIIQKISDARIAAAKHEYDYFVQQHPGATGSIAEKYEDFERERINTSREAEVEIQLERINLWKESNDAIIAEQKKVYEGIKSALDKVWDALLSKSQSVWQALGNALKTAVLGAMKEIVTSRLAASIAGIFGYGTYTFKRGIPGITEPPSPSGGPPLELPGIPAPGGSTINYDMGGSGKGSAERYVGDEINQYVRAAAIETGSQADTARMQSRGYAGRSMDDQVGGTLPAATGGTTGGGGGTTVGGSGGGGYGGYTGVPGITGGRTSMQQSVARLRDTLNIGKPITVADGTFDAKGNAIPAGGSIPWADATGMQRMGAILKSPAAAQVGLSVGTMLAISGLQRGGPAGGAEAITGSTLAGVSAASMFPALGLTYFGGALLGAGLGTLAYGIQRGGKVGAGLDVAGGALAGGVIGTAIFPGLGTAAGALIGAGVGAIAGGLRLLFPTLMERIRSEVKRVYGVDIPQTAIRKQIADIITQKYGGNLSIGIYSQDVQEIVRLYAISTGQGQGGLPRPEYAASFAQSGAGGLQIQPVYSGGQLIQNPYVGTTSTQLQNALLTNPAVYMQLNPQQANSLFAGQVVKVLNNNPGTVAAANTSAARNGQNRTDQATALNEPLTVTR